jgi:hypothetical protein
MIIPAERYEEAGMCSGLRAACAQKSEAGFHIFAPGNVCFSGLLCEHDRGMEQ